MFWPFLSVRVLAISSSWLFLLNFLGHRPDYNPSFKSQLHQQVFLDDLDLISVSAASLHFSVTWKNCH